MGRGEEREVRETWEARPAVVPLPRAIGSPPVRLVPRLPRPGSNRSPHEREQNQRKEVREESKADDRRLSPYSSEQRMMGLLAELGERYRLDYQREFKIRDEAHNWFVTHVDFAWPRERLVIEVYGGVHRDEFFDKHGTLQADDARRIAEVRACGWRVLVVHDTELTQRRWRGTVQRVERFLNRGRAAGEEAP